MASGNWGRDVMALLVAIARHQLLTSVFVSRRRFEVTSFPRAKGGLTGSILALTLARIPVESSFVSLYPSCAIRRFQVDKCRLVFGACVDNFYCASEEPTDAYRNLTEVFDELSRLWGLELKEVSMCALVSDLQPVPPSSSQLRRSRGLALFKVWFHFADLAGSDLTSLVYIPGDHPNYEFAFIRHSSTLSIRGEGTVKPFVLYKLQAYGAIKSFVRNLRSLQRVMVSRALGNHWLPYEAWKDFRHKN